VTFWSRLFFSSDAKDRKKRKRKPVQFAESTSISQVRYGRTVLQKITVPALMLICRSTRNMTADAPSSGLEP
jgi:hypothetical protein